MQTIFAAGGVVYKEGLGGSLVILMIYRNGVWDLPKGKKEDGESFDECARREVAEETGLKQLPVIKGDLSESVHFYKVDTGEEVKKVTRWYSMTLEKTPESFTPQKEEGVEKVKWVPLQEAKEKVGYKNLEELLDRFRAWAKKSQ